MATLIVPPQGLNPSTDLPANLALINDNFIKSLDYASALQPDITSNLSLLFGAPGGFTIAAGDTDEFTYAIYSYQPGGDIAAFFPEISIYIDVADSSHLFPDGTSLTSGQRAIRYSVIPQLTSFYGSTTTPYTDPVTGKTIYVVGSATIIINNGDSGSHNYFLSTNFKIFTKGTSLFR